MKVNDGAERSVRAAVGRSALRRRVSGDTRKSRGLRLEMLESRQLLAVVEMTEREQLLLELVNRSRANPEFEAARYGIELNDDISEEETITADAKQPLAPHQALIDAARFHSQEMLDEEFFAHVNPNNNTGPSDRARAAGYPVGAGENIAWFGARGTMNRDMEVYLRHRALFLSPEHRVNMLNADYREIGTGIKFGVYDRLFSIMVTENFGARAGNHFLTGVAYSDRVTEDNFYTIGESLPNVTVTATRVRDGKTFTATTGPSGGYSLPVDTGVYTVTATGPGLKVPIVYTAVAVQGQNAKVDFNPRTYAIGSLAGTVYHDQDKDGTRDDGEPPLEGRAVYIDSDTNGSFSPDEVSTLTDASGNFKFSGLRSGLYTVRVVSPEGWGTPASAAWSTAIQNGQNREGRLIPSQLSNDLPVAVADAISVRSGVETTLAIFDNDDDEDGTIAKDKTKIYLEPEQGQLRWDATKTAYVYRSNEGFVGTDSFEYAAVDDLGFESNRVKVTLTVTASAAPQAQNDQFSVVTATATPLNMFANDSDSDGTLVLAQTQITKSPLHGSLTWNAASSRYIYRSVDGYLGSDSFEYTVVDNDGKSSSPASVQLTITAPPNVLPIAVADQFVVETGVETPLDLFVNDRDEDGTLDLAKSKVVTPPQHGQVRWDGPSNKFFYSPTNNFLGTDSFEYSVTDDEGGESAKVRVDLTVEEAVGTKWQNPVNSLDVNNDNFVSSIDALLILNVLETLGGHRLPPPSVNRPAPPYVDVNGDSNISPQDALLVVNEINRIIAERKQAASQGTGEGEAAEGEAVAPPVSSTDWALLAAAVDQYWERQADEDR